MVPTPLPASAPNECGIRRLSPVERNRWPIGLVSISVRLFHQILALAVLLSATAVTPILSARSGSDLDEALSATGKYWSGEGDYVILAVDDTGKVSGFFQRDGRFGQFDGRLVGTRVEGYWFRDSDRPACASARFGSRDWGRVTFSLGSPDRLQGLSGSCDEAPHQPWSARR